jgi:hypothetical protein
MDMLQFALVLVCLAFEFWIADVGAGGVFDDRCRGDCALLDHGEHPVDEDIQLMRTLESVMESIFQELDRRIEKRWSAESPLNGFWRSGDIPALTPVESFREYGFWQSRADLSGLMNASAGMSGQLAVLLIGGHVRIGLFLPDRLLEGVSNTGEPMIDAVSKAQDGQPATIIRRMGGDTLFDRVITDPPFSSDWFLACTKDEEARKILEYHLCWRAINTWESALRVVLSKQSSEIGVVVYSAQPLPSSIANDLPLTIQDAYEIQPGQWVTLVTMNDESLSKSDLERQLQSILPDHHIIIQKDTI